MRSELQHRRLAGERRRGVVAVPVELVGVLARELLVCLGDQDARCSRLAVIRGSPGRGFCASGEARRGP